MVERYGSLVFYGDIQTPAVKARNSSLYPVGAWDLGFRGADVNIAMVDTGVDNEHPGLSEKFVAGYDAVCYTPSIQSAFLQAAGSAKPDGTFDPDDGHQHGTACMGMAAATGIDASGAQTDFYGAAPDADLIDVRIGTDLGAGPFENFVIEQEFYESAMNIASSGSLTTKTPPGRAPTKRVTALTSSPCRGASRRTRTGARTARTCTAGFSTKPWKQVWWSV